LNTALHFGCRNGNDQICGFIIDLAKSLNIAHLLVNCRNAIGFTPLLSVCFRGYHTIGNREASIYHRFHIIEKLVNAGADPNYCRPATKMTPLHWLAHNDDTAAIKVLLEKDANYLILSHDENLPIDIAGTTPSFGSIDAFLNQYQTKNQLVAQNGIRHMFTKKIDTIMTHSNSVKVPTIVSIEKFS